MKKILTIGLCIILLGMIAFGFEDQAVPKSQFTLTNTPPGIPSNWTPLTTHNMTQNFTWTEAYDINNDTIYTYVCISTDDTDTCNVVNETNYTDDPQYNFSGTEANWEYNFTGNVTVYYVSLKHFDGIENGTANTSLYFNLTDSPPVLNSTNTSSYIDDGLVLTVVRDIGEDIVFNITNTTDDDNSDNFTIYVCQTDQISENGCTGGQWCNSTLPVADFDNLNCSRTMTTNIAPNNINYAYFFSCDCPPNDNQCPARCSSSINTTFYVNHAPTMDTPTLSIQ